jgi:hypothetical protein
VPVKKKEDISSFNLLGNLASSVGVSGLDRSPPALPFGVMMDEAGLELDLWH